MSVVRKGTPSGSCGRWPHIRRFLRVNAGVVEDDHRAFLRIEKTLSQAEQATANEEWADFYRWQQVAWAGGTAADRVRRHLMRKWADDMAYCCQRAAAIARGEDPGEWVPQTERRPDLAAEGRAILADQHVEYDRGEADRRLVGPGVAPWA